MKNKKIFYLILITLIILFAVDIAMKLINSRLTVDLPEEGSSRTVSPETKENKPYSAYSKITERNLFQNASSSEPEEPEETETVPVTDLKLVLKGTVVGSEGRSFAVIEDQKLRTQNLFHLDDTISSGVTLSSIHPDRVVINRNGEKELLLMFQEPKGGDRAARSTASAPASSRRTIERSEIREAVGDLRAVMRDVRIIPHFTAGKRDGFTVTYVRQGSRLEDLGLMKNDIITEINGTPAEEFRNIIEIFNRYADVSSLDLGVERDSEQITITYSIE
ncbi:MAG: type II secretion system protein N [bacterium]|nr:type II secretion system protein N [bacterium]